MSEHGHRLEEKLVARYKAIDDQGTPPKLKPKKTRDSLFENELAPVPFIGQKFGKPGKRILVYGSAENLTYLYEKEDRKPLVRTRHRGAEKAPGTDPFRQVHIGPINNGGLLTVARYLLHRLKEQGHTNCEFSKKPREFIEEIAVANFGKFSIKGKTRNRDYAGNGPTLAHSVPYVAADLEILTPDILILPYTIYNALGKRRQKYLFEDHGNILIVGCLQFAGLNSGRLKRLARDHQRALDPWLEESWISKLKPTEAKLLRHYLSWMSSWDDLPEKGYTRPK